MSTVSRNAVPVPGRAAHRPWQRGFLVPAVTSLRDDGVTYKFGRVDGLEAVKCMCERRCQMCGNDITEDEDACFLGGIGLRWFTEPPLHVDCARYSLQVCPMIVANAHQFAITVCREYMPVRTDTYEISALPTAAEWYTYDEFMEWSET